MSEPVNKGSERSERSEAERCEASERSGRCERTNVASDRVALSKRDRLRLETPPFFAFLSFLNSYWCIILSLFFSKFCLTVPGFLKMVTSAECLSLCVLISFLMSLSVCFSVCLSTCTSSLSVCLSHALILSYSNSHFF